MQETQEAWAPSLGREDPLEEDMAAHSSILAWEIPWPAEPGGLQSMGAPKSQTRLSDRAEQRGTHLMPTPRERHGEKPERNEWSPEIEKSLDFKI